jgi:beta-glucosidase
MSKKKRDTINSAIDDQVNHEVRLDSSRNSKILNSLKLYLWPSVEAVKANLTSVMCSYNKFGGSRGCGNQQLLTTLLKNELDFQGFVVSGMKPLHPVYRTLC